MRSFVQDREITGPLNISPVGADVQFVVCLKGDTLGWVTTNSTPLGAAIACFELHHI
jgi:hypothetical protein